MAAYKMSTESENPTQFVREVSETFLILKIFNYVNILNTRVVLQKQLHLFSVLIYQLQGLTNIFNATNTKNSANIFQYISQLINYKDTIITDLLSRIINKNKINSTEYADKNTNETFVTKFEEQRFPE